MFGGHSTEPVRAPERDTVRGLETETPPAIVSISDIHGHLPDARSALLTLRDHPSYDPIVEEGKLGRLQWAGGDKYVLVFNGDSIDRGAHNDQVVEMIERLIDQAPPGHVRVTLGNHEMGVLTPDYFSWENWYSVNRTNEQRKAFVQSIEDGHVVAAYEGYNVVYAHAGQTTPYDVRALNDEFITGALKIGNAIGTAQDGAVQQSTVEAFPQVFGLDGSTGRGPDAGVVWLDFEFLPADSPPQVVGHTRQENPIRKGNVICQNVIRSNNRHDGGEAVIVETPERITALGRMADERVQKHVFSLPEA